MKHEAPDRRGASIIAACPRWPRNRPVRPGQSTLAALTSLCHHCDMTSDALGMLFQLPPDDRAELAIALWESLEDEQREAQFSLSSEQAAELDRRLREHLADPTSAIPWEEVRSKLAGE